jgi:glycosyltransferase involved in cell wall biosynthesis
MKKNNRELVGFFPAAPFFLIYGGGETQLINPYLELQNYSDLEIRLIDLFDKDVKYDIIHFFGLHYSHYRAIKLAKAKGIKVVLSPISYATKKIILGSIFHRINSFMSLPTTQWLHRECLKLADYILPNSFEELNYLESYFHLNLQRRSKVVYNAISHNFFENVNFEFRDEYMIDNYILCVGKIEPRKNQLLLAKLLSNTEYKLVFVGAKMYDAAEYYDKFQEIVNNSNNIVHINEFPQTSPLFKSVYKSAKVHVLLGENETPGMVSIEAGVAGCNIVVHDCKPVREYFGDFAFYCKVGDNSSIINAIKKAFHSEKNPKFPAYLTSRYNWNKVASDYRDVYKSLI